MTRAPEISVVIPVFNAEETLTELVSDFLSIEGLAVQVILVDDGSSDGSASAMRQLSAEHPQVESYVQDRNLGAGIARNLGFEKVTADFTIFFDADDILHGDVLREAVSSLKETGADVAMMPYFYRRNIDSDYVSMNLHDSKIWHSVMQGSDQRVVKLNEVASILGFSNYPWNKVIRTKTYQKVGLRYGSTIVNNDILGHWYSLLFANDILLLNQEICTHIVELDGSNLSNRHSRVRLSLFDALDETYSLLESDNFLRSRYSHHYWSLAIRTARWAYARVTDEMKSEFNIRFQQHLMRVDIEDFARIRQKRAPHLADDLLASYLA